MRKLSEREVREAGLIVGAGLIGVLLSSLIDTVLKVPFPYNLMTLLIGILVTFLVSMFLLRRLPVSNES